MDLNFCTASVVRVEDLLKDKRVSFLYQNSKEFRTHMINFSHAVSTRKFEISTTYTAEIKEEKYKSNVEFAVHLGFCSNFVYTWLWPNNTRYQITCTQPPS